MPVLPCAGKQRKMNHPMERSIKDREAVTSAIICQVATGASLAHVVLAARLNIF